MWISYHESIIMSNNIAKPSNRYSQLESKRELSRTLIGGTDAMIDAGRKYMPKHPAEEEENYQIRLKSTTLYGAYHTSIMKMAGKVFSKSVLINPNIPTQIESILDNIDGQGRNITSFLFDVFVNGIIDGISFIFVDYTAIKQTDESQLLTALDVKNMGARSTAILYSASQIIDCKHENIGGVQTLTCVRISECVNESDPDDEWGEKTVEQIRVLRPGSYELWRKDNKENWYLFDSGLTAINYIPLIPFYTCREGYFEGLPPLQSLAELCKQHWNSSSEQVQALTFARFAMMVFAGISSDETIGRVGPNQIIKISSPDAKWGLIETAGHGIEQGRADIDDIEKRMLSAGMTARVESKAGVTATASAIDSSDADSILMAWATSLEDVANQMLFFIADYEGLSDGGTVEINKSFAISKPDGSATELLSMCTANKLSNETFLNEMQRRDVISDSIDVLEEMKRITLQIPVIPTVSTSIDNNVQTNGKSTQDIIPTPIDIQPIISELDIIKAKLDKLELISNTPVIQQKQTQTPIMDMSKIVSAIANIPAPIVNVDAALPIDLSPITHAINNIRKNNKF